MAGREPSREELSAANIVVAQLGGTAEPRDDMTALEGMHDFDIELPDRRVALEVTSAVDGAVLSLQNTAFGQEWPAPELQSDWWVGVPQEAVDIRLRKVRPILVSALRTLEAHGTPEIAPGWVDYGIPPEMPAAVAQSVQMLFNLGIDSARSANPVRRGAAQMHFLFHGGASADFDQLHQVLLEKVNAKAPKLLRADADERHVFVWLDGTYPDAEMAVAILPPPSPAPELPAGIDAVWLATPPFDNPERVWVMTPSGGWRVLK
ncbi:MAG: hypothetical protein ACR2QA_19150 [Solirubrobacteraceae bacterium]